MPFEAAYPDFLGGRIVITGHLADFTTSLATEPKNSRSNFAGVCPHDDHVCAEFLGDFHNLLGGAPS